MIPWETTWQLASVTILFPIKLCRNTVRNFVVKQETSFFSIRLFSASCTGAGKEKSWLMWYFSWLQLFLFIMKKNDGV